MSWVANANQTKSMNASNYVMRKSTKTKQRILLSMLMAFPFVFSQAQDSEASDEDVFELSPFTVDASGDSGYYATSTLAGSRLNTSLQDVAASITVVTPEFLEDIGATNIEESMVYVAGVETDLVT